MAAWERDPSVRGAAAHWSRSPGGDPRLAMEMRRSTSGQQWPLCPGVSGTGGAVGAGSNGSACTGGLQTAAQPAPALRLGPGLAFRLPQATLRGRGPGAACCHGRGENTSILSLQLLKLCLEYLTKYVKLNSCLNLQNGCGLGLHYIWDDKV